MDVKTSHLESFVVVARLRSFTRAAALLHLSQPALTVQIKQLEESLGVRLLDRNTRSVKLTPAGKGLAPEAQRMIKDLEALVATTKRLSADDKGAVCVAAITSVSAAILPLAIARFKERYPGISVQIKDAFAERVINMVREETVDFGIASLTEVAVDLQMSLLFRDRLSAVFAPRFPLGRKYLIRLKDLVRLPLILMDPETSNRRILDRAFEELGYFVKPAFEVTRTTTATALAEAGLGVAILPSSLFKTRRELGVQVCLIQDAMLTREIGVIQKFGRPLSPEATSFMSFLKSVPKSLGLDTRQMR